MSCSPFDLRDYFLKELAVPEQSQVEAHVKSCADCRTELDQLRLTEAALCSLREEESPQRIAFVSDKIFEPSPLRRAWSAFWGSGARLGFAGAGMLSAAIMVSAWTRPVPIVYQQAAPVVPAAAVSTVSDTDIQSRIDAAVTKAVSAVQIQQDEKNKQLVDDLANARFQIHLVADELARAQKRAQTGRALAARAEFPSDSLELK